MIISIDVETTGLIPGFHEIIQVAYTPVDDSIKPIQLRIKAKHPQRATQEALDVHGLDINIGTSAKTAKRKLYNWLKRWKINKIDPLGHNYASLDGPFQKAWLGHSNYQKNFSYRVRDTSSLAMALKDAGLLTTEDTSLQTLLKFYGIDPGRAHTADCDSKGTLELYYTLLEHLKYGKNFSIT